MHTVTWISSFLCVPVKRTPPYSRHLSLRSHTFRTLKIVLWQITCKNVVVVINLTIMQLQTASARKKSIKCSRSGFYVQLQSSTFYPLHQNLNKHGWKEGTALRPGAAAMTTPTSKFFSDTARGAGIRRIFSLTVHLFLFTLSLCAIKPVERHLPNVTFSSATSANWWASWGLQSDVLAGRRQEPLSVARQFPHVWEQSQRMSNGRSTSNNRG